MKGKLYEHSDMLDHNTYMEGMRLSPILDEAKKELLNAGWRDFFLAESGVSGDYPDSSELLLETAEIIKKWFGNEI